MPNDDLVGALRGRSLHALLILLSKALCRAGYGEAEFQGRRQPRQKSSGCGYDLCFTRRVGRARHVTLVKVIVDDEGIRTRMADEMAGVLARTKADVGIVATPFNVSPKATMNQASYLPARVETMDGEALASLMRCSGVAVRPDGSPDYAFLEALEEQASRLEEFVRKEGL